MLDSFTWGCLLSSTEFFFNINIFKKEKIMIQGEHSAILLTFIKLPFAIKIFVLSIFELPLKTGFTVFIHRLRIPMTSGCGLEVAC